VKLFNGREFIPLVLSVIAFGLGIVLSPYFLDLKYLYNHTSLFIETGILAIGMTFVILTGQIDLSVGSTLALVACTSATLLSKGFSLPMVLLSGAVLGALLGLINGLLIGKLNLPSFVVTLGTMAAYRGGAQILMHSKSASFPLLGLAKTPMSAETIFLFSFFLLMLGFGILLHRTVFGRWVYSVGSNLEASIYSGIPADRVTALVFTLNGLLAGIAGLVMNSRLGLARQDHGLGLELDAITAVVLGGASIYGGSGTMAGTLSALILLGIVRTEMGIANILPEYQLAAVGSLLVLSVLIGNVFNRTRISRKPRPAITLKS